jgi:hypothetical protein
MTGFQSKRASALARLEALKESPSRSVGDEVEISRLEHLIDRVLDQIVKDVEAGDLTAIQELLFNIPEKELEAYLPEVTINE